MSKARGRVAERAVNAEDSLAARLKGAPKPTVGRRKPRLDLDWMEPGPFRDELSALLGANKLATDLVQAMRAHSPFLSRIAATRPDWLAGALAEPPEAHLDALLVGMRHACSSAESDDEVMPALRQTRQRVALLVALADLGGVWGLGEVTSALTRFADAAVGLALDHALRDANRSGRLALADPDRPGMDCGYVLLAMGKHGAGELNYSSDVDLIALHDPARAPVVEGLEPGPFFARLTQRVVRLLQSRTADDYVLRVDLRLRPDPGSTPPSVALPAAYQYYETVGQNWERAAFIKARAVAGDIAMGERFLADLAPFIWRRHLDFKAIAALRGLWRDVRAVHGEDEALEGRNVKLGPGGIRECELAVQALQLVFGGRDGSLRGPRTLDMLAALEKAGHLPREAVRRLAEAYAFLRQVEHRLQMRNDEQTQILPRDGADLDDFSRWCGFANATAFEKAFAAHTVGVRAEAAKAFGDRREAGGDLPASFSTKDLAKLGFRRASEAATLITGWMEAPERASVRAIEARRALTAVLGDLIGALARTDDPDAAIAAFDRTFARMAAPTELFAILAESEPLRRLFAAMLGSSPRLAEAIIQRPHLLDVVIDVRALSDEQTPRRVEDRIATRVASASSHEEALDLLRDAGREEWFLAGARFLGGGDAARLGAAYTVVAEASLRVALDTTMEAFAGTHGEVDGAKIAVVAMGRLGSREMTATSDLDLIVIYETAPGAAASIGARPLDPALYFSRLTHRLITSVSALTAHGRLYEIDMRLRPSGGKGPVALPLSAFVDYQMREAETWEHLALTRARPVAGDPAFSKRVAGAIERILGRERDQAKLARDVRAMRRLLAEGKGNEDAGDVKNMRGGLTDIDFCAQFLILAHGSAHGTLISLQPSACLAQAAELGLIAKKDADTLMRARSLFSELLQRERLRSTEAAPLNWNDAAILRDVARHLGFRSSSALAATVQETRIGVAEVYERLIARAPRY